MSWGVEETTAPATDSWGSAAPAADDASTGNTATAWGGGGENDAEGTAAGEATTSAAPATGVMSKEEYISKAREAGWTEPTAVDFTQYQNGGAADNDWHGAAQSYEWKDEYGDVGPEVPQLELILFGGEFQMRKGERMQVLEIEVSIEGPVLVKPIKNFAQAGLHPVIQANVDKCGYDTPTPIQAYTIPAVLQAMDVVAIAQTGSGKTAAYLVPVLSRLMGKAKKLAAPKPNYADPSYNPLTHKVRAEPLVVIVVPTRELAIQIFDEARRLCYRSMLRPCVAYGGLPMKICLDELRKGCDILIASPGRLCDLMDRPDVLTMTRVKYTIIDEADEMLNSDWEEELAKIMAGGDSNEDADHIYMMFSATFPKRARELARNYMATDHYRIRVGRPGSAHKNIKQEIVYTDQNAKKQATYDLLYAMEPGRTLIFCNSKMTVDIVDDFLFNRGLPVTSIHADRHQKEREDAIRAFRTGKCPIMIATGVSSRGLDIANIKHVINYDLPSTQYGGIQEYIHRIGRTGRIGHQGLATSFYNDRNEDLGQDLVNILVECEQEVPEFLSHLAPEDGVVIFDDDSGDEDEAEGETAGAAVNGGKGEEGVAVAADGAWGAADSEDTAGGFQADESGGVEAPAGW